MAIKKCIMSVLVRKCMVYNVCASEKVYKEGIIIICGSKKVYNVSVGKKLYNVCGSKKVYYESIMLVAIRKCIRGLKCL